MDRTEALELEVRRLRREIRDLRNRFAEEGARLNTEISFWKLKFFEACMEIPGDEPVVYRHAVEYDTIMGWDSTYVK